MNPIVLVLIIALLSLVGLFLVKRMKAPTKSSLRSRPIGKDLDKIFPRRRGA